MKKTHLFLLSASAGILLGLSFPPIGMELLAFVGFTPLLFLREEHPQGNFWYYYIAFFFYNGITNWWIGSWQPDADPYLMVAGILLIFIHPFFFTLPMMLYSYLRNKLPGSSGIWTFPFVWVVFEWWKTMGDLAYPWLTVGYTQAGRSYWVQFADISGVWGISFFITIVNVLFLKYVFFMRKARIENELKHKQTSFGILFEKPLVYYIAAGLAILIIPNIYGYFRVKEYKHTELLAKSKTMKIGLIQPNINPWTKWQSSALDQMLHQFIMTDSLIQAEKNLDLVVWNETAIPYLSLSFNSFKEFTFFENRVQNLGVSLLTGFTEIYIYGKNEKPEVTAKEIGDGSGSFYQAFNSAILFNAEDSLGKTPQIYRKMKLTPFSEWLPYVDLLPFAKGLFEWKVGISSWGKGNELKNLKVKRNGEDFMIAPVICIESVFPRHVSEFAAKGASLIVIITNDAWYDHTFGPEQHYLIATMRAIENRRYIARCANSGISGFITASGETIKRAPQYKTTSIAERVPIIKETTFYSLFGDWLPFVCAIYISALLLYVVFRKTK